MSKTAFSKGQLIQLHRILASEKLIPCDKIELYTDPFNSGIGNVYTKIKFVKDKKQIDIGLVTKTNPKNEKLKEQLYKYFGGKR